MDTKHLWGTATICLICLACVWSGWAMSRVQADLYCEFKIPHILDKEVQ